MVIKSLVKYGSVAGLVFVWAVVGFYFYGSSSRLPESKLARIETYPAAAPNRSSGTVTVMTYNLGWLCGMTNNQPVTRPRDLFEVNLERASALLKTLEPDLAACQEIDFDADRSFNVDQSAELARRAGFGFVAAAVNWDKRYVPFPYWPPSVHFGQVVSGQALLSRWPLSEHRRVVLARPTSQPFYYNAFYLDRLAQVVVARVGGREVAIINVHLEAWDPAVREVQAGEVVELVRPLKERMPLILLGDFNTPPLSARRKDYLSDERIGRDFSGEKTLETIAEGLDLKAVTPESSFGGDERASFTYPSEKPAIKIDHIFYDPRRLKPLAWRVVGEAGSISDHLPVLARFRFLDG